MSTEIGHAHVGVSGDNSELRRDIAQTEAMVEDAFRRMDALRAAPEIAADSREVRREIAEVKADIIRLDAMEADPEVTLDDKVFTAQYEGLKAKLRDLEQRSVEIQVESSELAQAEQDFKNAAAAAEHFERTTTKTEQTRRREMSKTHTEALRMDTARTRSIEAMSKAEHQAYAMEKARVYDLMRAEHQAYKMDAALQAKADQAREKSLNDAEAMAYKEAEFRRTVGVEVERLRERYAALQRQTKAGVGLFASQEERIHLARLQAEMRATEERVRNLGGTVRDIDVDIDRHNDTLKRWATSMSNIRVHMGIMSLTIGQFFKALVLGGPVISGLIGATGALIGSLGSGLMGAAGVGAAGLTALGISAIGLTQAVQPAFEELNNIQTAMQAAKDAAIEFGKGSKEARDAQKELDTLLKNSDPTVSAYATSLQRLGDRWQALTGSTRDDFFSIMTAGAKGLQTQLPMLARNLNDTMQVAKEGAQEWIETFTGPAVSSKIDNLLSNFTRSLPSVMQGFEHLGVAFVNTMSLISNHFESLGGGFENWAQNIRQATESLGFEDTVSGWIDSMRAWGGLLQSTGRLLATFFNAGKGAGDGLIRTLTDTFDRWREGMQTVAGQNSLADFFQRSSEMAQQFFSTMGPILEILFNLAQITQPIAQAVLNVVEAVADLVNAFTGLAGVKEIISGIATAWAAWFVLGKIIGLVRTLVGALGLLKAAQIAGAGTSLAAGIAAQMGTAAVATKGATTAATGLSGVLTRIGLGFNPLTAGLTALGAAGVAIFVNNQRRAQEWADTNATLNTSLGDLAASASRDEFNDFAESVRDARVQLEQVPEAITNARQAVEGQTSAEEAYAAAVEESGRKSDEAYDALYRLQNEREKAADAKSTRDTEIDEALDAEAEAVYKARNAYRDLSDAVKDAKQRSDAIEYGGADQAALKAYNELLGDQADAHDAMVDAINTRAGAEVQVQRQMAGTQALSQRAIADVGAFSRAFKNVPNAKKLSINTNSAKATADLAKVGNQAKELAGRKATVRVLADSNSAQEAIVRLRRLIEQTTNKDWKASMGFIDRVTQPLTGVIKRATGFTGKKHTAAIDATIDGATTAFAALFNLGGKWASFRPAANAIANTGAASSAIGGLIGQALNFAGTYIATFISRHVTQGKAEGGLAPTSIPGFYGGADEAMMARAHNMAAKRAPQKGGGQYSVPTYMVGEENRREWVIATNPAYRDANKNYLKAAANDLGMIVVEGFASGGNSGGKNKGGGKGPTFGPRSEYENLKNLIALSESTFGNKERHYQEQLALGVKYPQPGIPDLIAQKDITIDYVNQLIEWINTSMMKRLKKTATQRIPKKGKRPPAKHEKALKQYQDRQEKRERLTAQRNEARDQIPQMKNEVALLRQDLYGYELDKAAITQGGGTGGGGGGATIEEQFAGFNAARYDLYKTMASNFQGVFAGFGAQGATSFAAGQTGATQSAMDQSAAPTGGKMMGQTPNGGTSVVTQTFQNNFAAPPPDAHTWANELAFEAGAVGG